MPLEFGKQAVCVNELGKQAWLGLVSGSKKEESNKEIKNGQKKKLTGCHKQLLNLSKT